MLIEFDPAKRDETLSKRGLDFALADQVFAGAHATAEDVRENYGEARYITIGLLDRQVVVLVWTPRGEARRVISMRKANERERAKFRTHVG